MSGVVSEVLIAKNGWKYEVVKEPAGDTQEKLKKKDGSTWFLEEADPKEIFEDRDARGK